MPVPPDSIAHGEGLNKAAMVELRGLEPLTFSLRRHGVDLTTREHSVIDVQVAAAGAPWLHRGAHMGHTTKAQPPGD